jgi:hypothetical protein
VNNIGEVPFTMRDYFKFTGGFRGVAASTGTNFNVSSNDISFLTLRNNRAKNIESQFGAVNFSYAPKKTWDISGFAIYSGNRTEMQENTENIYSNTGISRTNLPANANQIIDRETTENATIQNSDLGLFKVSSSYKPNADNQFDYDIFAKVSQQKQDIQTLSRRLFLDGTDELVPVSQYSQQAPYSVNQNLNYYYTLNEKHIFSFEAQHLWQDEDPFYNAELKKLAFANLIGLNPSADPFNVEQRKRIKTNKIDAKLDYFYVLNAKSNLNVTVGTTQSEQNFNSNIYEILNGNKNQITAANTSNDVSYYFGDVYAGIHYKFITGIFTFNQGFNAHTYIAKNTQLGTVAQQQFTRILPDASIKVNLKKSETLQLRYAMQTSFTDVNQLAEGYVFNNYNSLYSGNRELENSLSHNVNLSYFSFNMFNYTNVFASINYSKRIDAIKSNSEFIGVNQVRTSINSQFADESLSGNANFQKSFRKFKLRLGANITYAKSNSLLTNRFTNAVSNRLTKTFSQSYRTRFSTNFRDAPNFDVGYNVTINRSDIGGVKNTFTTHSPFINTDVYFLKAFAFTAKYTFNQVVNSGKTIDKYGFLRANISYQKKDSPWEYRIEVTNLLDANGLNQNSSNDILVSNSTYFIQPRIGMFSVTYNL